jgi:hypothetical protein
MIGTNFKILDSPVFQEAFYMTSSLRRIMKKSSSLGIINGRNRWKNLSYN